MGFWSFEEGTGNTTSTDYSGHGNNGAWNGTSTHYATGKVGSSAGSFNGVNDYVSATTLTGIPTGGSARSVVFWFKRANTSPNNQYLIGLGDTDDEFTVGFWTNTYFTVEVNGGYPNYVRWNHAGWTVEQWYMLAITYDGTNVYRSSINGGALNAPNSFGGTVPNPLTGTVSKARVGNGIGANYFGGTIDDLRIYNRALSAAEIQAIYNATR